MLNKLSQQNKEEAPLSAMHFWTPQSSLKDIKYNYFKLGFTMKHIIRKLVDRFLHLCPNLFQLRDENRSIGS